jgi:osmotically-inducible protein OsmY
MKRHKTWVAVLVTASLVLACAPALALDSEPSLKHPSDAPKGETLRRPANEKSEGTATPADLNLKRKIRDALVANDELTALGKNVAIDARDGNVTLRGTVTNLSERILVADIATRIAGPSRVDNALDILFVS